MPRSTNNPRDLAARSLPNPPPAPRGLEGYTGGATVQSSNDITLHSSNDTNIQPTTPPADVWELASYKIRSRTKTALHNYVRRAQSDGAKITIGGQLDEVLTAWLREQGIEV